MEKYKLKTLLAELPFDLFAVRFVCYGDGKFVAVGGYAISTYSGA